MTKNGMVVIAFCLALGGCGDDSSSLLTWGETCERFTEAWCEHGEACGNNTTKCREHVKYHCCELWDTCGEETPEAESDLEACEEALSEPTAKSCFLAVFGYPPEECYPVFDYDPREE